jgi:hypothetical protein
MKAGRFQRKARLQALSPGPTRDAVLKALDETIQALSEGREPAPEFRQLS